MAEITRITVTKNPGYGCSSHFFQESITITSNSIEYKLIPHMHNKVDAKRHWSYKSNKPLVRDIIKEAFDELGKIIRMDESEMCYDIGSIEFIITYSDKTKIKKVFWRPVSDFRKGFIAIRDLVPHIEDMPRFLKFD
ncbi:MAG: hypothetical protein ACI3XC_10600 [Phascolarctobacterium sp.]